MIRQNMMRIRNGVTKKFVCLTLWKRIVIPSNDIISIPSPKQCNDLFAYLSLIFFIYFKIILVLINIKFSIVLLWNILEIVFLIIEF